MLVFFFFFLEISKYRRDKLFLHSLGVPNIYPKNHFSKAKFNKNFETTKARNWKFGDMISLYMKMCTCSFGVAKQSWAPATCMQNSGRYFKKINSTKNDGIQIRYLMVKFQLFLRKLIIQAF